MADAAKLLEMPIYYSFFSHGDPILINTNEILLELPGKM
jgi:hypothetical protein